MLKKTAKLRASWKQGGKLWTAFIWIRMGTNDGHFLTW